MLRSLQKFSQLELPVATSWVGVEEDTWKKIVEEDKA
jgi:hypothetical protein